MNVTSFEKSPAYGAYANKHTAKCHNASTHKHARARAHACPASISITVQPSAQTSAAVCCPSPRSTCVALGWMAQRAAGVIWSAKLTPGIGRGQVKPGIGRREVKPGIGRGEVKPGIGRGEVKPGIGRGEVKPAIGRGAAWTVGDLRRHVHGCASQLGLGIGPRDRESFPCRACAKSKLGSPHPHLRRDWAHPMPHLRRDRTRRCHICSRTGPHLLRDRTTSAPGPGHIRAGTGPHPRRDRAHRSQRGGSCRTSRPTRWRAAAQYSQYSQYCIL